MHMRIQIVTLFPEFFAGPLQAGLLGRAQSGELLSVTLHNPRNAAADRHKTVDDRPYGGGPGMVMLLEPLAATLRGLGHEGRGAGGAMRTDGAGPGRILMMSPKGPALTQERACALAAELAAGSPLTLVCGRYEGIDARLEELFPIEHLSIGDFVLNGGETAALAVIESVARLVPGFMGHSESGLDESFSRGLLEYPQYTRPERFEGLEVPAILRSGDHGRIAAWRREQSLAATLARRPDLLAQAPLSAPDMACLRSFPHDNPARNLFCALVHYPVLDKDEKSVAVSLTNLDIHDIARSSCTYGLGGYYVTTPLEDQRRLLATLTAHWTEGDGAATNPDRAQALRLVRGAESLEEAARDVAVRCGAVPYLVATSASGLHGSGTGSISFSAVRALLRERPVLLAFGTGQGLAPSLTAACDAMLPPLRRLGKYNHLSVRAAAAIVMDRIVGDW